MYKIETHLHTVYGSYCGKMDETEIVKGYLDAGYSAVVVTDHFHTKTDWYPTCREHPCKETLNGFLEGYLKVRAEGEKQGLKVYRGAEVRFFGSINDYLVLNYPDWLLEEPDTVFSMGLERFHKLAQESGALVLQAHPFRCSITPPCTPADPRFLDGVEIFNGNLRHNSQNDLALVYAEQSPWLIRISGSDCHQTEDVGRGGILVEQLPRDDAALAALLRAGNYTILLPNGK